MSCEQDTDFFTIPDWVRNHPEVKARGIELEIPLKPLVAWRNFAEPPLPQYVVKILKPGSEEADIYDRLHKLDPASPNHTIPCDVIRSDGPLLILPCLWLYVFHLGRETPLQFAHSILQIVEGLDFLHSHHIAHYDIVMENIFIARKSEVDVHPGRGLVENKIYIVDLGESRQFKLGPGEQSPVEMPLQHRLLPVMGGKTLVDPYSWDVFLLGITLQDFLKSRRGKDIWLLHRYAQWLVGNERAGCTGVCHCRPTIRRAHQVFKWILLVVHAWELCRQVVSSFCRPFSSRRSVS